MTKPIPPSAKKIVKIIRKDIPRPEELPKPEGIMYPGFRWENGCCPMGLHPDSDSPAPTRWLSYAPKIPYFAINEFGIWWDTQGDAEAAMNAVWGEEQGEEG